MSDLIDRQAAIDALDSINCFGWVEDSWAKVSGIIEHVPSAQRTGRWKVANLPKGKMKYCSECGFGQYIADERQYRYCPNCGCAMKGEDE